MCFNPQITHINPHITPNDLCNHSADPRDMLRTELAEVRANEAKLIKQKTFIDNSELENRKRISALQAKLKFQQTRISILERQCMFITLSSCLPVCLSIFCLFV